MKYKNIFITGSTGVVGKPLLKKLIENGHNVYALSRSEENKKILESKGVSVISGNILTIPGLISYLIYNIKYY